MAERRGETDRLVPYAWLALLPLFALLAALAGCTPAGGPPTIRDGDPCAACGMAIHDRHFASARGTGSGARVYDAIECLLRDSTATGTVWLPDYDQSTLHAADSMWVVRGEIVSPMGGGYAAFLDSVAANAVAVERAGRVGRLADFAGEGPR